MTVIACLLFGVVSASEKSLAKRDLKKTAQIYASSSLGLLATDKVYHTATGKPFPYTFIKHGRPVRTSCYGIVGLSMPVLYHAYHHHNRS